MSHTFRCRHSLPKDFVYRDGGWLIMHEDCPSERAYRDLYNQHNRYPWELEAEDLPEWFHKTDNAPVVRGSWMNKEKASWRLIHTRRYRRYEKRLMHHGRWEDILPYKRTSGWLTW